MSGPVHIGSTAEWQSLLSDTSVVIADFYADWCGPCKMIAPHFERLAKEHSRPKKVAFAKVNVDNQTEISQANSIRAMPTFKIFHNGTCVETIQGANPSALTSAITKAVQLSDGGKSEDLFKSPGRTLGGGASASGLHWSVSALLNLVVMLIDAYKGAENSIFNKNRPRPPPKAASSAAAAPGNALLRLRLPLHPPLSARPRTFRVNGQLFSTSRVLRQDPVDAITKQSEQEIEKVVREAKQRFRDTLPTGYLNEDEYALYVRLYGPPLRETAPEDVGIPMHADMGAAPLQPDDEGTALRELEDGGLEEVTYKLPHQPNEDGEQTTATEESTDDLPTIIERAPGYVDVIARNQREHDALTKLMKDFEVAQKKQRELEKAAAEVEEEPIQQQEILDEDDDIDDDEEYDDDGMQRRFHPYTLAGKFHVRPIQLSLPQEELIKPITELLDRTHLDHVKAAAEAAFGGQGLPTSPATPAGRTGNMGGIGLPPDQKHMTEIEADAFLAGYIPPTYASVLSSLREVRKRLGNDWIQSRLKQGGGLSVLDAGAGGAGLLAWEEILWAEWTLLKEKGEVEHSSPPGRKTVVAGSDRLRQRLKTFLYDTTFLPRLPDYEHSGEMQGEHLEAGNTPQPRKSYDLIIASHLFLKEEQPHHRQAVLNNLWSLLNKDGGVLLVIEKAHPRGFEAVAHVRDTVLKQFLLPQSGQLETNTEEFNPAYQREPEPGHIVAPCTNQGICPMYREAGKSQGRKDFCHFTQRFVRPPFYSRMFGKSGKNQGKVEFSYVAIQRGHSKEFAMSGKDATVMAFEGYQHAEEQPDMQSLPRIVLQPLKRKGHVTLDVCTSEGRIERWTVPRSFSKLAYHDARKSRWGDLWPLGAKTRVPRKVRIGGGVKPDEKEKRSEKKKSRKSDALTEDGQLSGKQKRVAKKRDKRLDLIQEILEAESFEEDEIEREMDVEEEEGLEVEDGTERRDNGKGRRR
ncbi:putative S-adenosyl-L-methionine-dependent RNA methyltransferase Rsm22-2 [Cladobotryum mycophilum]|uniref:S-adenosyl-L-methionine-dependent RNA methyltransferase Rsm22-2 n=1 Tax=Cladobotryum mycophilum TaxID=491253 RepID=A0ABR0SGB5_9HYPO